ncbi:MAG: hypothetical protein DRM97_04475 [Thermoprotei archaeon]|nr:MAG: hypothetical protein DRM97_04475 [Thermoprotei archaeon]
MAEIGDIVQSTRQLAEGCVMRLLRLNEPISAGIILSYRCTCEGRHCMYACSPRWSNDWFRLDDLKQILSKLAYYFMRFYPHNVQGVLGLNYGLHFTGGEPFLNFNLLLEAIRIAKEFKIPSVFVETNCFWCVNDDSKRLLLRLKEAGLDGILISINPFTVEFVPYENMLRALKYSIEVFGRNNVMLYHPLYYELLNLINAKGRIEFEEFVRRLLSKSPALLSRSLDPGILLPMGRLVYRLEKLYEHYPARQFFNEACTYELTRPWHIHIDCYCNYVPGYCAGISLGDARRLNEMVENGIELDDRPILQALCMGLGHLYRFAVENYGYRERRDGYISKCHLCLDIRRHIVERSKEFKELQPLEFYRHL